MDKIKNIPRRVCRSIRF